MNSGKKILLTGATGYIGKRLLPALVESGHQVVCCVRDRSRFNPPSHLQPHIEILEVDFLDAQSLSLIPEDIDAAYYLIHSMSSSSDYQELELRSARNFREAVSRTECVQVIYLSGIVNEDSLSKHLASRKAVEQELENGPFACTTLRAGIIIGSGSASFEIIRDLVEKLPIMIAPIWIKTRCQPIAVRDVIDFLTGSLFHPETYNRNFDIGGPEVLSYRDMMLGYAGVRGLKRTIITVPVMTPRLSSYWLYFVTSVSYRLATALVSSMKVEVICRDDALRLILGIEPLTYEDALKHTLHTIEDEQVPSSWKDSWVSGRFQQGLDKFAKVPDHGCFVDKRELKAAHPQGCIDRIWRIGGTSGWYYADALWEIRGLIDKLFGGVGLRRGRTNVNSISTGDTIDFWRVLHADKDQGELLLFAEMKVPGEAWLEFKVSNGRFSQTATFRPKGVWGRAYWYLLLPVHNVIFKGMAKKIAGV